MPGLVQPTRKYEIGGEGNNFIVGVTVVSLFTGKANTMELPPIPLADWLTWQSGVHIQNALPYLSPDQREFLLSGATPEEWNATFPEED